MEISRMDLDACNALRGERVWVKRPATGLQLGKIVDARPSHVKLRDIEISIELDGGVVTMVYASQRGDIWNLVED
jgi:hypothetical protein